MNQSSPGQRPFVFSLVPDPNPWDEPATLPPIPRPVKWLLPLLVALLGCYNPLWASANVPTLAVLVACVLALWLVVRSLPSTVWCALLFVLGAALGGASWGAYALCFALTLALSAYLICTVRSPWLLAVPVLSYAAALLAGADPLLAVLALLPYPAAGLLAMATMKNSGRVGAIVVTSATLLLSFVLGFALLWYQAYGTVSWQDVRQAIEALREDIITTMQSGKAANAIEELLRMLYGESSFDAAAFIRALVEQTFNLLPAMVITLANVLAFVAQAACNAAFCGTGLKKLRTHTSRLFILSVPAAIIFIVCTVAQFFASEQTLWLSVMQNLQFILFPGMCLAGAYKLIADTQQTRSLLMIGLCIAAALFATTLLIWGLAISGALTTLLRPLVVRMVLMSPHGGDGNDTPSDPPSSGGASGDDPSSDQAPSDRDDTNGDAD